MEPADWIAAGSGLLGALVGAGVGYWAAMRTARRAGAAAWAANAMSIVQVLLDADDPQQRELGAKLLEASVRAIADAEDTPERIKRATRGAGLATVVDQVRSIESSNSEVEVELEDGDGRSA